jgi:hypothetical protein
VLTDRETVSESAQKIVKELARQGLLRNVRGTTEDITLPMPYQQVSQPELRPVKWAIV